MRSNTHKMGVSISDYNKIARSELNHVIAKKDKPPYFQINDILIIVCLNSKGQEEEFSPRLTKYVTNSVYLWQQVPLEGEAAPEAFKDLHSISFGSPVREDDD